MTHTSIDLPAALYYADLLDHGEWINYATRAEAVGELRRLHAESEQHLQELRLYRITVENREARIAELKEQLAAAQQGVQPDVCAQEVFNEGVSIGLFDIPKHTANAICSGINAATGAHVDWHYIGGRVHLKALPATHPTTQGLDADMFWDADDPEICQTSINNVVVEVDSCRGLKVGDTITVQRAVKLPDLEVRITMVPDSEGNGDLEWEELAAKATQGG